MPSMFYPSSFLCVFPSILLGLSQGGNGLSLNSARFSDHGVIGRQAQPAPGQLRDFAVYPPVLVPEGSKDENGCVFTKTLAEYTFENSYGTPFVGE